MGTLVNRKRTRGGYNGRLRADGERPEPPFGEAAGPGILDSLLSVFDLRPKYGDNLRSPRPGSEARTPRLPVPRVAPKA